MAALDQHGALVAPEDRHIAFEFRPTNGGSCVAPRFTSIFSVSSGMPISSLQYVDPDRGGVHSQ
jgi:hypothetical protein